nr:hypothetical protein [Tanacetum cinerariifolium]
VPTTQPSPVVSTQGTPRILSGPTSLKPKRTPKKKEEQVNVEYSALKKSLISAKEAEARENIKLLKEVVLEQETDKMIEGDEEDLEILDKLIVELGTMLDQGSHK